MNGNTILAGNINDWARHAHFEPSGSGLRISYSGLPGHDLQLQELCIEGFMRAPHGVMDPFPGSAPNSNLSICVDVCNDALRLTLEGLDAAAREAVRVHSHHLYGRTLSHAEVAAAYTPLVKPPRSTSGGPGGSAPASDRAPWTLRLKVSPPQSGRAPVPSLVSAHAAGALRCRGVATQADGLRCHVSPDAMIAPMVSIPNRVWKMPNGKCGLSLMMTRVVVLLDDCD